MSKVKVNDIQVYYDVKGEGFPLVMIMGLSANADWWYIDPHWIQELSEKFKLVMFDNRGAGRTDVSDRRYAIKLFADDTAGLLDALGISKADVFGISMGGMIAQELVLNYPEKVEKLVLCSTYCGGTKSVLPSPKVLEILTADRSMLSPEEIARMSIPLFFRDDFIKKNPNVVEHAIQQMLKAPISNEAFTRQLNALMEFDTYDRLSGIKGPTLILHGKQDVLVPPENGSILAEAIPNAEVVYLKNSAHGLVEETEKVIPVLLNFLVE
ncbi:MAG: alpha/beta hydrolase [Candidatus Bathyarchaeota archaeon]|nr:alpha/beta hydrolase [Candidatus Bathyarchaeota archaeon]MDH5747474.1 alpha/beta hydrolase [Candidatus Bathyarchaeota archaeon]